MSTYTVRLVNGATVFVNGDSCRVADGVLYVMRAPYSGGIREVVKAFPLANVLSWGVTQ